MRFAVVINDEEQYSVWPAERAYPPGWRPAGPSGPRAECLDWIAAKWTDQRPRSLRAALDPGLDSGLDPGLDPGFDSGLDSGLDPGFDSGLDSGPCR